MNLENVKTKDLEHQLKKRKGEHIRPTIIGKNIRLLRERLGLSQEALADYLKVSHVTISYYETGQRTIPSRNLLKISELFGIDAYKLSLEDIQIEENITFTFRTNKLSTESLEQITAFHKVIKNYLKMINDSTF
ncbi:helix-turn-helix domain-containing protein [Runella zeae]|uniref:helix-turn-helix domain-containing protein n=1 Tax=Runella zeae TaxID=94255 RepID=UPI0003F77833|nr:helix-turn-helix transcriptional regulator [Runella zeae]